MSTKCSCVPQDHSCPPRGGLVQGGSRNVEGWGNPLKIENPPTSLERRACRSNFEPNLLPTKPRNQTLLPASLASPSSPAAQRPSASSLASRAANQPASQPVSQPASQPTIHKGRPSSEEKRKRGKEASHPGAERVGAPLNQASFQQCQEAKRSSQEA